MSDAASPDAGEAGFTLIEVLISLFIFSIISVGAMIALTSTLDVRESARERMAELDALSMARRIMADDFAAFVKRENRDSLGGFVDPRRFVTTNDRISFVRRGRSNPGGAYNRGDLWRINYRIEDGALIRSFFPHENPAQLGQPIDRVLLEGVEDMRVEPWREGQNAAARWRQSSLTEGIATVLNAPVIVIRLAHSDGTETEHLFETGTTQGDVQTAIGGGNG